MKRLCFLLISVFCFACSAPEGKPSTETHHIKTGKLKEVKPPLSHNDTTEKKVLPKPSDPTPKPSDPMPDPQPVARCADAEKCLRELENEHDDIKRKAIIDALAPMFDTVQVMGSRGNQVSFYSQEKGNLWLGLDKIGDSNYEFVRQEGRKIVLRIRI